MLAILKNDLFWLTRWSDFVIRQKDGQNEFIRTILRYFMRVFAVFLRLSPVFRPNFLPKRTKVARLLSDSLPMSLFYLNGGSSI